MRTNRSKSSAKDLPRPLLESLEGRCLPAIAFEPPLSFVAGSRPSAVLLADFNGDEKLDLAVANSGGNDVTIQLGYGDGTFGFDMRIPTGPMPMALASGDFNGDGKADLVSANFDGNEVRVFLGRGDGTFGDGVSYPVGAGPATVAVGDLNGDHIPDLAVGNRGDHISILLGRGDGTFAQATTIFDQGPPNDITIADMNRDGKPDLVVAAYFGVQIMLGRGDGTFHPLTEFDTGGGMGNSVVVADFNNDGLLDVVQANAANYFVTAFQGDGSGGLVNPVQYPIGTVGENPLRVKAADLDGDGNLDLLIADRRLTVLRGTGTGDFFSPVDFAIGNGAVALAVGDLNGDGRPDVVTANQLRSVTGSDGITVLLNSPPVPPPALLIENSSVIEGDSGLKVASITVRLSAPALMGVIIKYSVAGGTATPGQDFDAPDGFLTFAPGETVKTINVKVVGDRSHEGPETVVLRLSDPIGATVAGAGTGVLTINDDDGPSVLNLTAPFSVVSESSGVALVVVTREGAIDDEVTVAYATLDETGVAGVDYQPVSGVLRFAPGETRKTIAVPIVDDARFSANRAFYVMLGNPSAAGVIGAQPASKVVVLEDDPAPTLVYGVITLTNRAAVTGLLVGFSGPLNPSEAVNPTHFRLTSAGFDQRFGTRDDRDIPLRRVVYHPSASIVQLIPVHPLALNGTHRLTVTGLTDRLGQQVDGDGDGLPGGVYQTTIGGRAPVRLQTAFNRPGARTIRSWNTRP